MNALKIASTSTSWLLLSADMNLFLEYDTSQPFSAIHEFAIIQVQKIFNTQYFDYCF